MVTMKPPSNTTGGRVAMNVVAMFSLAVLRCSPEDVVDFAIVCLIAGYLLGA